MVYEKSNMEPGGGAPAPQPEAQNDRGPISTDGKSWLYPSLSAGGLVEVELPAPPGSPHPVERLHARDFGVHVVSKIEKAFRATWIKRAGSPQEIFNWYSGAARGAGLLDAATQTRMNELSRAFAQSSDKEKFFLTELKPFLASLTAKRRA